MQMPGRMIFPAKRKGMELNEPETAEERQVPEDMAPESEDMEHEEI